MKNWLIVQASKAKKFVGEKVVTLTLTKLNELLMNELVEALGPHAGMKKVFEGGMNLGHEFMMELSAQLESTEERIPAYGEAAWIMFSGKKPTTQSFEKKTIEGEEIFIYTFTDEDSPWVRNISFPHRFCQFPAGAFQGAGQTWSSLMREGEFHVITRETKCKAVGDPFCEFIFVLIRKELPLSFLEKHMPELFEDIDTGFIDY
jgi:hypothetical protein